MADRLFTIHMFGFGIASLGRVISLFLVPAFGASAGPQAPPAAYLEAEAAKSIPFVCPMDRDVSAKGPGKCPKCGMALIAGLPEALTYPVNLRVHPAVVNPETPVHLEFEVLDPNTGERVKDFEVVHEKLFHLLIGSNDLTKFYHEHPELADDGTYHPKFRFPKPGAYRMLCDLYPKGALPQIYIKTITTVGHKMGMTESLVAWRAAEKLRPDHLRLLQLMVIEYGKGRFFAEAAAPAKRALSLQPDDEQAHYLAIKAMQDAGDNTAAADMAKEAARKFPGSARANFEHGFHLQKTGKVESAAAYLKKAMELDPSYEEPPFFCGDLLMKLDRTGEAIPFLRAAIRNRQDYIPARVLLARALMKQGQFDQALTALNETVKLAPDHPQPRLLLSQIYFRLGEEGRAKEERELSLRLRRENPALLEAVQGRPFPPK
jgi:tetratricopeptide (TPR) repeat protein